MGQAQPPVTAGTHPMSESLVSNQMGTGQADANGNATWTFPAPPAGQVATGTMCCATAPTTAQFVAAIGATILGDWAGDSIAGPWQSLNTGQPVTVTATGLIPNTPYLLSWIGSVDDAGGVQPTWPEPNNTSLESLLESPLGVVYGPNAIGGTQFPQFAFNVPDNARTLIIVIEGGLVNPQLPTTIQVTGNRTGIVYYNQPPYIVGPNDLYCDVVVPVNGAADDAYTITVSYASVPAPWSPTFTVYSDSVQYPESIFYNGVGQLAWSTTAGTVMVIGPARLLGMSLASSGAAELVQGPGRLLSLLAAGAVTQSFPPNTILPIGQSITLEFAAAASASISFAYP